MSPTVWRFEVPVDERWHEHELSGPILAVASRRLMVVEFWAEAGRWARPLPFAFVAIATGQPIPAGTRIRYVGSTVTPELVWHLYLREPDVDIRVARYRGRL